MPENNKKIITYNVNGVRAALSKGFGTWLQAVNADIICLQEIKAGIDQIDIPFFKHIGYHSYWYPAQKKGYSGVAILSKEKPLHVEYGCGIESYDAEGRIIRADFSGFSVFSAYFPSGTTGEERQQFKYMFLDDLYEYFHSVKKQIPKLIISGDYNICHTPKDIHNPISNANSSGFLPEERAWVTKFLESGFVDVFRHFNQEPHHYTWWSYRANARQKNLGWRIDYHLASAEMKDQLRKCVILPEAKHSDHCPVLAEIEL